MLIETFNSTLAFNSMSMLLNKYALFSGVVHHHHLTHLILNYIFQVKADNAVVKVQGLEGIKFKIEENALDNGIHNEANKCYCRGGEFDLWI